MNIMKATLAIISPLAIVMALGGALLVSVGFFGGEPGGEVGRQLVGYRWVFVVMVVIGIALLVSHELARGRAN